MKNNKTDTLLGALASSLLLWSMLLSQVSAQTVLTLEDALGIAEKGSPSIQRSLFNIEQNQYSLTAERASLKSRFFPNPRSLFFQELPAI